MLGRKPGIPEQTAELEREILAARAEQRAAELNREQAIANELRALGAVDGARAVQTRCTRIANERIEAISSLQDELAALIPRQAAP